LGLASGKSKTLQKDLFLPFELRAYTLSHSSLGAEQSRERCIEHVFN
jgi:hypothetical protein